MRCYQKRSIRDQQDPVKRLINGLRELWQKLLFQPIAVRLSFFTTRVLFIDADKEGYVDYLNKLLPLMRPGGLILAHNIGMANDYDKLVRSNRSLETLYYQEGEGMAITLKKL